MLNEEAEGASSDFGQCVPHPPVRHPAFPFSIPHSAFSISSMPYQLTMPQQSDTMTEGTVVKWLRKEGDKVNSGDTIAEIETDKATMEIESFESGTVAALLVPEGAHVPVGQTIAVLATGKENPADVKKQ